MRLRPQQVLDEAQLQLHQLLLLLLRQAALLGGHGEARKAVYGGLGEGKGSLGQRIQRQSVQGLIKCRSSRAGCCCILSPHAIT